MSPENGGSGPERPGPPRSPEQELRITRVLADVRHLRGARQPDGSYDPAAQRAVWVNDYTQAQEDGMSAAVTETVQPRAEVKTATGELRMTYIWEGLGKTALQVAESGYAYHKAPQVKPRIHTEVREAIRNEDELTPGTAQSMLSLKMPTRDAPYEIAKQEHLADEDAIRVATAVVNEQGTIVGRRMRSLLVRDVPLKAWVAMLKDPNNRFKKSFDIEDEESALCVMQLFDKFDLPEEQLPEGPVSFVADVVNYIEDPEAKQSVERQLTAFRGDQEMLHVEAARTADEWLKFEISLAESLHTGKMHLDVLSFVMQHQAEGWPDDVAAKLRSLEDDSDGVGYRMDEDLAVELELAWQKVNIGKAAIIVNDERALKKMDKAEVHGIQQDIQFIRTLEQAGVAAYELSNLQASLNRRIATSNVEPGGGCSGTNGFSFKKGKPGDADTGLPFEQDPNRLKKGDGAEAGSDEADDEEEGVGAECRDTCRTSNCPSGPGETKVGGCRVCLGECQPLYDAGMSSKDIEALYAKLARIKERRIETAERAGNRLLALATVE